MDPIRVGTKRSIVGKHVLGIQDIPPFDLSGGEIIEVLDKDIYSRYFVKLQDKKFWIWAKVLDQISKEI